eukprot:8332096-Lingulodinium_polyedra.AAC.1
MCANAAIAHDKLQLAMGRAPGMDADTARRCILRSQAARWAAMPRHRILLATLPRVACSFSPNREWPWAL